MMKRMYVIFFMVVFCLGYTAKSGFSFSDQTTTERIIKENRSFIDFINIAVTNFANVKKDDLKQIYEKHFNAEVAYLQFDYKRAYTRIYSSQGDMVKLYEFLLRDYYLEASKKILDEIAPEIIRSKNSRARLYLTLGYRDRTVSWTHYVNGISSNPKKYSYKLYKYEEAIKMARRAKRYAFLALFESQSVKKKYEIYNYLLKKEKDANVIFFNRFLDKSEEDMIKEMNKSYEDYLKDNEERKKENKNLAAEKNVEKRVRFRNENRAARYLLNRQFEKAEDIMRQYVDEFNFKLTSSTFDIISQAGSKSASTESVEKTTENVEETVEAAEKTTINVAAYKTHLMDNYLRLTGKSILLSVMRDVKIDDDIGRFKIERDDIPPIISKEEYEKIKREEAGETEQNDDIKKDEKVDEKKDSEATVIKDETEKEKK